MGPSGGERARQGRLARREVLCFNSAFFLSEVLYLKTLMSVLSLPLLSLSPSDYLPLSLEQEFSFNLATDGFLVPVVVFTGSPQAFLSNLLNGED